MGIYCEDLAKKILGRVRKVVGAPSRDSAYEQYEQLRERYRGPGTPNVQETALIRAKVREAARQEFELHADQPLFVGVIGSLSEWLRRECARDGPINVNTVRRYLAAEILYLKLDGRAGVFDEDRQLLKLYEDFDLAQYIQELRRRGQ